MFIRPATANDAPAIALVHVRTWQSAYRGQIADEYLDTLSVERRTSQWQDRLAAQVGERRTFVAELDGRVVAFCSVGKCRDEDADDINGELYAIYVDPQAMNLGVGSALMKAGREHLVAQGFARATLWVLESNQRARRFYESKGWIADGVTRTEEIANAAILELRYAIRYSEG
jgi:ribosomal protein S18 acetylase RimI-like enzyme